MQSLPKMLLIEDDRKIAGALAHALKNAYDVESTSSGKLAIYKTDRQQYDIIVLDLNLPDMPGIFICQQLRDRGLRTPILILTGEAKILTKINLLDAGANDYLTKPFSLGEFNARLRVLVRSAAEQLVQPVVKSLVIHGVSLDRQRYSVTRDGVNIPLRRKEFDILECLLEQAGHVVSRDALSRRLWADHEDRWTNTVTVHIKSLRDKIDRPFNRALIQTVHGRGYKFEAPSPAVDLMKVS
jgi:two-component system OmpR family response regulator